MWHFGFSKAQELWAFYRAFFKGQQTFFKKPHILEKSKASQKSFRCSAFLSRNSTFSFIVFFQKARMYDSKRMYLPGGNAFVGKNAWLLIKNVIPVQIHDVVISVQ